MKRSITIIMAFTLMLPVFGQSNEPEFDRLELREDFLYNFNLYTSIYIEPVIETINYNSISGWQFTAEPLAPGKVRIDIATQATFQSDAREFFNFNDRPFTEEIELERTFNDNVPTALGGPTDRTFEYVIEDNDGNEYRQEISAWSGAPTPFTSTSTAVPIISVGLPSRTEVSVRFFPYMAFRGVEHSEIGVGLKHEVGQYTNLGEQWNWNVGVFYNLNRFGYTPEKLLNGNRQELQLRSDVFMVESMISKDWEMFSLFSGLGLFSYNSSFDMRGEYQFDIAGQSRPAFSIDNPISIQRNQVSAKFTVGGAFHWDFFHLAASGNFSDYTTVAINLAFDVDFNSVD